MAGRKRRRIEKSILAMAIAGAMILAAGAALQYLVPGFSAVPALSQSVVTVDSPVLLNEVMASNSSAVCNEYGEYADWIEIINVSDETINLKDWSITQAAEEVNVFLFPDQELEPGECVALFADGRNQNTAGYVYHAPFKLASAGGTLKLFNAQGELADQVEVPKLKRNQVYRRDANLVWEISSDYTPALPNTLENYLKIAGMTGESEIVVSEVMASNASYAPDSEGLYHDYIELYNTSQQSINLEGYYLSDTREMPLKWRFPQVEIPAGGYLLVYASGLSGENGADLHTNFKLSSEGEEIVLSDREGKMLLCMDFPALEADQAYSLIDGEYTTAFAPTPGLANAMESARALDGEMLRANDTGITINELCASDSQIGCDWVEIYNGSSQTVDLSDWGISDNPGRPRKWQFPQGTTLAPGQYLGVCLSGYDGVTEDGLMHANFRIGVAGNYTMVLSTPEGEIVDRVYVPQQYGDVSYGRIENREGFYYMTETTPLAANAATGYDGRAQKPEFSAQGGVYATGETISLEITAEPGAIIRYTLDGSEPTQDSAEYTGPLTVQQTTVVRAKAWVDNCIASYSAGATYLFDVAHTVRVVAVSGSAEQLTGANGLLTTGSLSFEAPVYVEIYETDGTQLISQNCGMKIMGKLSRLQFDQKSFRLNARNRYETASFEASLFENRPYTQYDSFAMRASGQDNQQTRMRDSILSSLCADMGLMYQETEVTVVYVNGEYWGEYNMRERVTQESIAQFMGWDDPENVSLLEGSGGNRVHGSNASYKQVLAYVRENGVETEEKLETLRQYVDVENYLDYVALQMYTCNQDLNNVRMYCNPNADGKWRWVVYDLDLSFQIDQNSVLTWLREGGVGSVTSQDNTLFVALMKNPSMQEYFLTRMGELLATTFSYENLSAKIYERYQILQPEMQAHCQRWGWSVSTWQNYCEKMMRYAKTRPAKLIGYFQKTLEMSDAQVETYFGDAIRKIQEAQ